MSSKELASKIKIDLQRARAFRKPSFGKGKRSGGMWHCDVCDKDMKEASRFQHVKCKRHLLLEMGYEHTYAYQNKWHCDVCDYTISKSGKKYHLGSAKHRNALQNAEVESRASR